ncbi:MAG: lipocalin family protein [Salinimicrobium sp.]
MKKHLILLFLMGMFTFTSCSNDDDGGTTENSIVGTWTLQSISPAVIDLNCAESSTINLTSNGNADWALYDANNNCTLQSSSGTWEKNSGDNYTIYIPDFQAVPGTVEFQDANSFTFTTSVAGATAVLTFNRQI